MEIEVKYRATEPIDPRMVEAIDFSPYRLGAGDSRQLQDTLLDTGDFSLVGRKYALRVRYRNGQPILTLKGPPMGEEQLHRRAEWEVVLDSATPLDPATWPAHIVQHLDPLVTLADLAPILWIDNQRQAWPLWRAERPVGEMVLDRGTIRSRDRRMPVHEIEVELGSEGHETDLAEIGDLLLARLPLEPEWRSKLERGLTLLDGVSR